MPIVTEAIVPLTGGWDECDLEMPCRQIQVYNSSLANHLEWSYSAGSAVDGRLEATELSPNYDTRRFYPKKIWVRGTLGEPYQIVGVPG